MKISGSTNGDVDVYDTKKSPDDKSTLEKIYTWRGHHDCTNSISVHPFDSQKIATGSGQRHLTMSSSSDDDESGEDNLSENCVKVWRIAR